MPPHAVPDGRQDLLLEPPASDPLLEFPCSAAQERFWVLDQVDPGNPALNIAVRWQLDGPVSRLLLEQAFQGTIDRHEILRTAFHEVDGAPVQRVLPHLTFHVSEIDLTGTPMDRREAEAKDAAKREACRPFRMTEAPLLRATLLRLSASRSIMLVTAHHMVCDGWSVGVIAQEVGLQYAALSHGSSPPALPPLALQYADYALWRARQEEAGGLEAATRYWTQRLVGMRRFEVRPDHPRPAMQTANGHILSRLLPRALTDALHALARRHGATMFSASLAGLTALLHRYAGEDDVTVGTQVAGRGDVELEPLVGVFINTLVLRTDVSGNPTFTEHVVRVRDMVLDALANQDMPFERLVSILRPPRDLGRTPLFSVNFIFQRSFIANATYGDLSLTDLPSITPGALYDLNFFMVERPEGWRVSCEYNTDLFEAATVEVLLQAFQRLVAEAVADPGRPVSDYPLIAPPDLSRLLSHAEQGPVPSSLAVQQPAATEQRVRCHVVERGGRLALPNGVGELWTEWVGTDDPAPPMREPGRFVAGKAGSGPGSRFHRSGLLARRRHDGALEMLDHPSSPLPPAAHRPRAADGEPGAGGAQPSEAENRLAAIWAKILGVPAVAATDNFFDLGGHSLLATRMLSQVEAAFGLRPSFASLISAPTIRQFAVLLRPQRGVAAVSAGFEIVPINAQGRRTPIFAVNNGGLFHPLSRRLGADQPFTAMFAYDPETPENLEPEMFEQIAARYVNVLRRAQPQGPYVLLGLCVAGCIAFEMAQQLVRQGEEVPLVVVIEAWAPGYLAHQSRRDAFLANSSFHLQTFSAEIRKIATGEISLLGYIAHRRFVKPLRNWLLRTGQRAGLFRSIVSDPNNTWFQSHLEAAATRYQPQPYHGAILVLHSPDQPSGRFLDPTFGWSRLAQGSLTVHSVPGDHLGVLREPGVGVMARHIKLALETAPCGRTPGHAAP